MSTLKAWRQVVSPHEDIRRGRFDASVFAADLGEVMAGRGAGDSATRLRSSARPTCRRGWLIYSRV